MFGRRMAIQADSSSSLDYNGRQHMWRVWLPTIAGAVLLAIVLFSGARSLLPGQNSPVHLVVYAFSTQEEVLTQDILPAFEAVWEAETGRQLTVDSVFGPSATLAGNIVLGAPADVALFSNAHHVTYLRVGKRIKEDTVPQPVGFTPMVIVVRPGNPHNINDYGDLARPGLRLLHASPRSSGGGEWAVLAEYGSLQLASGDKTAATEQLEAIWRNVCLLAPSARSALTLFELGAGDALVTYEQDALLAKDRGVALEVVTPPRTIVAEPVAVIVDDNVTHLERPAAEALIAYLLSNEGQGRFVRYHQRPASRTNDGFPPLLNPFTVEDLDGWSSAYHNVVESLWQRDIEPRLDTETAPQLLQPDPASADHE